MIPPGDGVFSRAPAQIPIKIASRPTGGRNSSGEQFYNNREKTRLSGRGDLRTRARKMKRADRRSWKIGVCTQYVDRDKPRSAVPGSELVPRASWKRDYPVAPGFTFRRQKLRAGGNWHRFRVQRNFLGDERMKNKKKGKKEKKSGRKKEKNSIVRGTARERVSVSPYFSALVREGGEGEIDKLRRESIDRLVSILVSVLVIRLAYTSAGCLSFSFSISVSVKIKQLDSLFRRRYIYPGFID